MLRADGLVAGYLGAPVIRGVSLAIAPGEVFCLLGANGAGKSTIGKSLAGTLPLRDGTVTVDDVDVTSATANQRVRKGVSLVPEGRHLFTALSVRDNIVLGGYTRSRAERLEDLQGVLQLFPQLTRLVTRRVGDLSGGEQQMVAVGRALMARPRYLILDEPSFGLAPLVVEAIFAQTRQLALQGVGILLIEQNVGKALGIGDRAAVVEAGVISMAGSAAELRDDSRVVASYLGGLV